MNVQQLNRQNLAQLTDEIVRAPSHARPEIKSVRVDGQQLVVKDYHVGKSYFGRLLGCYLVAREKAAYQRLDGCEGIPRYYGTLDPYALILQHVPAQPILQVPATARPPDFCARLADLVEHLHKRGVVHGDLHRLSNILMDTQDRPVLVDFTTAIISGSNPMAALLFPVLRDDDWRGVYKLKRKIAPETLTEQERDFLDYCSPCERWFRRWREPVRTIIQRWSANRGSWRPAEASHDQA